MNASPKFILDEAFRQARTDLTSGFASGKINLESIGDALVLARQHEEVVQKNPEL